MSSVTYPNLGGGIGVWAAWCAPLREAPRAGHSAPDAGPRLRGEPDLVLLLLLLLLKMLVERAACVRARRQAAGAARRGRGCWCVAVRARLLVRRGAGALLLLLPVAGPGRSGRTGPSPSSPS